MNALQSKIIENINLLPENMLQEVADFSEFLKYKYEKSKKANFKIDSVSKDELKKIEEELKDSECFEMVKETKRSYQI